MKAEDYGKAIARLSDEEHQAWVKFREAWFNLGVESRQSFINALIDFHRIEQRKEQEEKAAHTSFRRTPHSTSGL